jgi:hypothetical protein
MPILGIWASAASAAAADPGAYVPIATTTVPSAGAATVTFSSIPSTYTHLQIRYTGRTARPVNGDSLILRFNGDTGSNYAYHALYGDGSSPAAFGGSSLTSIIFGYVPGSSAASNIMGVGVIDILDYANTSKNKTSRSLIGEDFNGFGDVALFSGLWINTAAVNSITISGATAANFTQYSSFTLYGIKG